MDDIKRPKKRHLNSSAIYPLKVPIIPGPILANKQTLEPQFQTPDEAAIADNVDTNFAIDSNVDTETTDSSPKKRRFHIGKPHGKKQWALLIVAVLLILGGSGAGAYWFILKPKSVINQPLVAPTVTKKVTPPPPTTEVSKLSGLTVPIGTNLKPVTAVQIENSPESRPQSGLKDASIVYEAIAEGGITRFDAVYQDTAPDYIGPVRSLRPYYIDWFWPFDASIAHVGGAPQALADIKSLGIKDLDQFYNSAAYDRITSRYAPHNVYTSIARLNALQQQKGFTSATYTGWARKAEVKAATPTARTINLAISGYYYDAKYTYDPVTNTYPRSEGGAAHIDEKSGLQLAPKVVVAIVMGRGIAVDGQHTEYQTVGNGHMYVFQDGIIQEGTWSKASRQAQWVFTDAAGKSIAFNPGQTWLTMVDNNAAVTYAP